jgi:tight adherence protein B
MLGKSGMVTVIGIMVFILAYVYSHRLFAWIEGQTYGTRTYIMEKLELLFIEMKPEHVTYILLFLSFGLGFIILIVLGILSHWLVGLSLAAVISFLGWKIPKPFINMLIERRQKAYQNQMVDAMTLLANGIRAGLTVPQAIGMVVSEMPAPISQEFNLLLQQNKIGVPLDQCFENLAKRVPTEDNDMFVSSVNILRETGGNLAEVFDTIVGVIRERVRLQQKIDTYTAQGMFQGATIASMPFAIGLIYFATDPSSTMLLFTNPIGIIMTIVAFCLDMLGVFVIMKIVKIKV